MTLFNRLFGTATINPGANDDPPPVAVIGGRQMRLVKVDWLGRWRS